MATSSLPGAKFVDPAVLARIGNLELIAKTVVDGLITQIWVLADELQRLLQVTELRR